MNRLALFLIAITGLLGLSWLTRKPAAAKGAPLPVQPKAPAKPEPPGGWEGVMNDSAVTAALLECKINKEAGTEEQLRTCALKKLFPTVDWETRTKWQGEAWAKMGEFVTQVAAAGWTFLGQPGVRDTAVVFWLLAEEAVRQCLGAGTLVEIKLCAAKMMFPKRGWPVTPDSPHADQEVWTRLDTVIGAQAG